MLFLAAIPESPELRRNSPFQMGAARLTAGGHAAKTSFMKVFLACLALVIPSSLFGAESSAPLNPGDPAPPIKVSAWMKGAPIKQFAPGKIYVVVFLATWSGPCRAALPALTTMAEKFEGKAKFLGVSVFENEPNDVARLQAVSDFVNGLGDKVGFPVAADSSDRTMGETWMNNSGQEGLPSAFIVNGEGTIAWIGYLPELEKALGEIVAGKFDSQAFAVERQQKRDDAVKAREALAPVELLAREGKHAEALAALEELIAKDSSYGDKTKGLHFQLLIATNEKAAFAFARELAAGELKDEPSSLAQMAQTIASDSRQQPDMELAVALAEQAGKLTAYKSPGALAVLADIRFRKGDYAEAVIAQEAAVVAIQAVPSVPERALKEMRATLEKMKKAVAENGTPGTVKSPITK
ncbi:MAG: TlpA disulfide reductase family protein [Chthoniobacteraceae bacterium]